MDNRNGVIDLNARRVLKTQVASDDRIAVALALELAHLRQVLRRRLRDDERIVTGVLEINISCYEVTVGKLPVDLAPLEFAVLKALAQNVGHVLSREQLVSLAWPDPQDVNSNRAVDTAICRIRFRLGKAADLIRTIRCVGYKLVRVDMGIDANRKYIR